MYLINYTMFKKPAAQRVFFITDWADSLPPATLAD